MTLGGRGQSEDPTQGQRREAKPVTVLVVGQTPPPVHGQSLVIRSLLEGSYGAMRLVHVRMQFSAKLGEVGQPRLRKLVHLARLVSEIRAVVRRERPDVLYYPPAGPDLVPALRDLLVLASVRRLFPRTVLHFLAAGVSDLLDRLPPSGARLLQLAYGDADCAIQLSAHTPPDAARFGARKTAFIPLGIDRIPEADGDLGELRRGIPRLLYVGHLLESKGVGVLLEAVRALAERGHACELDLFGDFADAGFERHARTLASTAPAAGSIRFHTGASQAEKWSLYARASIFCFPTHYEREAMPLVVLEAMQFALPVVATRWRGIIDLVEDETTGFLVPCRDAVALADRIAVLLEDAELRRALGEAGRARYAAQFTLARWREAMERALVDVAR